MGVPQRQLGAKVDKEQERTLLEGVEEGETEEMARLKSLTLPHGGDWVNALLWGFTCDSRSKGRHQLKKKFSFEHCPNHLTPSPPIRATWFSFLDVKNNAFCEL